ncbi:hypothetical protein MRX96_047867 [Rhipicephalus microplus]
MRCAELDTREQSVCPPPLTAENRAIQDAVKPSRQYACCPSALKEALRRVGYSRKKRVRPLPLNERPTPSSILMKKACAPPFTAESQSRAVQDALKPSRLITPDTPRPAAKNTTPEITALHMVSFC